MALDPATFNFILLGIDAAGRLVLTIEQLLQIAQSEPTDEQFAALEAKSAALTSQWDTLAPKPPVPPNES